MTNPAIRFAEALADVLTDLLERGMVLPFIVAAVSSNGSVLVLRYAASLDGLDATTLASHMEDSGYSLPFNIMVTDSKGDAVRLIVGAESTIYH